MLPKVMRAPSLSLSPPLSPFHTSVPVCTPHFLSPYYPLSLSLSLSTRSHTCTVSHHGAMLHISIYDLKTPVDQWCMCVCTLLSPVLTSGRRGLKDEREIMKCVFWPPQDREGDSRRLRLDSDVVYIKLTFTRKLLIPLLLPQSSELV